MEIEQKKQLLNDLGTGQLIKDIKAQEDILESQLKQDALYRSQNVPYLASYGDDCTEVKGILADLALEPPLSTDSKKLTAAQLEAWLRKQRSENVQLKNAIVQQNFVTFQVETNRIQTDMAKKRLESLKGLLGLRTAQVEFLARE